MGVWGLAVVLNAACTVRGRGSCLGAVGALAVAGMVASAAAAQPAAERPRFRSAVELVSVAVVVRDRDGRPVRGLSADDFAVLDGGVERRILDFSAASSGPVTLALLLDESGSMGIGRSATAAHAVAVQVVRALEAGRTYGDEVAVYGFDSGLRERLAFTRDLSRAHAALVGLRAFGATSMYDAIADLTRRLAPRTRANRALVVVTDGVDNRSRLRAEEVSGLASAIDVPVYVVEVGVERRADAVRASGGAARDAGATLADLARWTGGEHHVAGAEGVEARRVAERIVSDVREQYLLAFESAPAPGWRPLEVRARRRGLVVRARSAYMAGGVEPAAREQGRDGRW